MRDFFRRHKTRLLLYGYFLMIFVGVGYSLKNSSEDVFSLEKKVIVVDAGHGEKGKGDKSENCRLSEAISGAGRGCRIYDED